VTKDQWKISGYLLGIVVAIAGDGWAVQLDLSYRSDSITATDGGVVIQNNQGSLVTHTGSGDIHIGTSLEDYEAGLKRREQEVARKLKQIHEEKYRSLETEKKNAGYWKLRRRRSSAGWRIPEPATKPMFES